MRIPNDQKIPKAGALATMSTAASGSRQRAEDVVGNDRVGAVCGKGEKNDPGSVLDVLTLVGMVGGLAVMLWPSWGGALRVGFFVVLGATVAQIVVGHLHASGRGKA